MQHIQAHRTLKRHFNPNKRTAKVRDFAVFWKQKLLTKNEKKKGINVEKNQL